jgi:hypothetical protein
MSTGIKMKNYARIDNGVVAEIVSIEDDLDIKDLYHHDLVFVGCTVDVCAGFDYDGKNLTAKKEVIIDPRESMVISDLKAIDNLRELGKLNLVLDFMDAEPRDSKILWLWNRSKQFHRLDPTLVDFCTNKLGLDDKGIDNLFL